MSSFIIAHTYDNPKISEQIIFSSSNQQYVQVWSGLAWETENCWQCQGPDNNRRIREVLTNSTLSRPLVGSWGSGGDKGASFDRLARVVIQPGQVQPSPQAHQVLVYTTRQNRVSHQDYKRPEDKLNMKVNLWVQNDKFRFCISLNLFVLQNLLPVFQIITISKECLRRKT